MEFVSSTFQERLTPPFGAQLSPPPSETPRKYIAGDEPDRCPTMMRGVSLSAGCTPYCFFFVVIPAMNVIVKEIDFLLLQKLNGI